MQGAVGEVGSQAVPRLEGSRATQLCAQISFLSQSVPLLPKSRGRTFEIVAVVQCFPLKPVVQLRPRHRLASSAAPTPAFSTLPGPPGFRVVRALTAWSLADRVLTRGWFQCCYHLSSSRWSCLEGKHSVVFTHSFDCVLLFTGSCSGCPHWPGLG